MKFVDLVIALIVVAVLVFAALLVLPLLVSWSCSLESGSGTLHLCQMINR